MAKTKVFTKFRFELQNVALDDKGWEELERRWKTKLPDTARSKIDVVNKLFASVAPLHDSKNTATVAKVEKALNAWIKATGKLRLALQVPTSSLAVSSRAEIISRFYSDAKIKKIGKMQPIVFARYVIDAATEAALLTLIELRASHMDSELKRDLWLAWVVYLAHLAMEAGVKITASSSNKLKEESPFVSGILHLQDSLPIECRHYTGYESVAKGVQLAKKKYSQQSPATMLGIIAAWGVNLPGSDSRNRAAAEAALAELPNRIATGKSGRPNSRVR
jgi:hypothetical protein